MEFQSSRRRFLGLCGSAALATIAGCQSDTAGRDGTPPTQPSGPTATDSVLVSAEILKSWIDASLVSSDPSEDGNHVVIIRVGDIGSYEDGHLPGAMPWETLHQERREALASTSSMVPGGEVMDNLLQQSGVTAETTIVLSGANPLYAARGYWTLRYWGFPRARLKVLDAGYPRYGETYPLETGDVPNQPTTEFSVSDNDGINDDVRVSLGEMIQRVDSSNDGQRDDVIIDQRSNPVAKITNATIVPSASYHEGSDFDSVAAWRHREELESVLFEQTGIPKTGPYVTYCTTGYQGAMGFFVLDGLLNRDDVSLYDGSFESQWKHYDAKAEPIPNDAWRVDIEGRTEGHTGGSSLEIDPILNETLTSVTSEGANQIEQADREYAKR